MHWSGSWPRVPALRLYCAPGNAGTAEQAENVRSVPTILLPCWRLPATCHRLTVVGPEFPLALASSIGLRHRGGQSLGPPASRSHESSKVFAKHLWRSMAFHRAFQTFSDPQLAESISPAPDPLVGKLMDWRRARAPCLSDPRQRPEAVDQMMRAKCLARLEPRW